MSEDPQDKETDDEKEKLSKTFSGVAKGFAIGTDIAASFLAGPLVAAWAMHMYSQGDNALWLGLAAAGMIVPFVRVYQYVQSSKKDEKSLEDIELREDAWDDDDDWGTPPSKGPDPKP